MDGLIELIARTVYTFAVSTILVLLSRPVRWGIRRVVKGIQGSTYTLRVPVECQELADPIRPHLHIGKRRERLTPELIPG